MRGTESRPGFIRRAAEFVNEIPVRVGTYAQRLREEHGVWELIKAGGIPAVSILTITAMVLATDLNSALRFYTAGAVFAVLSGHAARYPQWPSVFRLRR